MKDGIGRRNLKTALATGGLVNGWCSIPSTVTAEIMARQGFDTITVDLQHGLIDYQTALAMLQVIDGRDAPTLCRVPWNEPGIIMKALDAGFTGIICPMVNTRAEADRFVGACRYAPSGYRSFGPTRALNVYGADYVKAAHGFITTIAMIETAEALDNLDDILGVEGLDAVYIGPADLSLSLGFTPTLMPEEPEVLDAIERIRDRTRQAGKAAGIHCGSASGVCDRLGGGFNFATLVTDARLFTATLQAQLAEARRSKPAENGAGQY